MNKDVRLLYVSRSPDPELRFLLASSGFQIATAQNGPELKTALEDAPVALVLLEAEPSSPLAQDILTGLSKKRPDLPVVLLAEDRQEATFARAFQSGLVDVLPRPLPEDGPDRLRQILAALPDRTNLFHSQGRQGELSRFVGHLMRTGRSGALSVAPKSSLEGSAVFSEGQLRSAQQGRRQGGDALKAMLALDNLAFSFRALAGAAAAAPGMVIAVDELDDEPLVPLELAESESLRTGEAEIPVSHPAVTAPHAASAAPNPNAVRLLLVDDDLELCKMFGLLFKKHGYAVTVANDGLLGYEQALSGGFDVVVADLNMPRMDGWGLLRLLRDDFRTRETPLAFLSCHDDYRESLKALNAGAQAYYSKGTRLEQLAVKLRELLEPRKKFRESLASPPGRLTVPIGALGFQWLVRELCAKGVEGRLDGKDSFASYSLFFRGGRIVHASAVAGRHRADGERAFNALVASKCQEAELHFGPHASVESINADTLSLLERAARTLNDNERRAREGLLVGSGELQVNLDLYAVYAAVGPKQWLETARMLCEEKLPPREVIARSEASPIDVEETMKDLLRRGVVQFAR